MGFLGTSVKGGEAQEGIGKFPPATGDCTHPDWAAVRVFLACALPNVELLLDREGGERGDQSAAYLRRASGAVSVLAGAIHVRHRKLRNTSRAFFLL